MKKLDLEIKIYYLGWWKLKGGGKHDKWTNGEKILTIPRHREINKWTAKAILDFAEKNRRLK